LRQTSKRRLEFQTYAKQKYQSGIEGEEMKYPVELVLGDRFQMGDIRIKTAAICICLDTGVIDGVPIPKKDYEPFMEVKATEDSGASREIWPMGLPRTARSLAAPGSTVWRKTHSFLQIQLPEVLAKAVEKIVIALCASVTRNELKPTHLRLDLDGQVDPDETWLAMDEIDNWCYRRSLAIGDCWAQYIDDEDIIRSAAVEAARIKRNEMETPNFVEDISGEVEKIRLTNGGLISIDTLHRLIKERAFYQLEVDRLAGGHVERPMAQRERASFQNIVGGLLALMLAPGPNGKPRSGYQDQAAILDALLINFPNVPGISQRNLEKQFPLARRSLEAP
jgi:hypothetical protein